MVVRRIKSLTFNKKGQMKIQQMAFMVIALFIFFLIAGLFFLNFQLRNLKSDATILNKETAISSLEVIASMPELSCDSRRSLCLDEDKLKILSEGAGSTIKDLWPVESVEVYKVYPSFSSVIECPATDCNYYNIYKSVQTNTTKYSTYVSLCKKLKSSGYVFEYCEIAKLIVGMKIYEN